MFRNALVGVLSTGVISFCLSVESAGADDGWGLAGTVSERTGGTVDPTGVTWTDLGGSRDGWTRTLDCPTNVTFYSLACPSDAATDDEGFVPTMARDIALYGSNDGANWTLVDEEPYSIGWTPGETRYWMCAATNTYSRYRLTITANNGGATTAVGDWGLYAPARRAGATYYVDVAKGDDSRSAEEAQSAATPWRTISKAAEAMIGGDTALVAPGVYREQVTIGKSHAAGTAVDPMRFLALDPNDRPIVSGAQLLDPSGWQTTVVTNFEGKEISCLVREIGWKTPALFAGLKRLVLAHEPEQVNGDDPYELDRMMTVSDVENPEPYSKTKLTDTSFFVQSQSNYWKGATLMVYDGYSNFIEEQTITNYDPVARSVSTEAFSIMIGPNGKSDKWALKDHLCLLDAPGEFYIEGTSAPYRLYLVPPENVDLATLAAVQYEYGISTMKGGLEIDGFRFQSQSAAGFYGQTKTTRNLRVRNCEFCHILGSGVSLRYWVSAGFSKCVVSANTNNGFSFANGVNCHIFDCSISTNANNGIWSGNGGGTVYFSDTGLTVRGCDIFDQTGRRLHPDNFQMHMNDNVVIEGNRLRQSGEQNGWCQYTGHLIFRNNVLTDGPFGFGSVRYADISHNVFDNSQLRFDSHLDDHPVYGAWYCPIDIKIYANIIRSSSIAFPAARLVDRFEAFEISGNRYLFAENSNARKNWDWAGKIVTVKRGTVFVANDAIVDTAKANVSDPFEVVYQITWSDLGFVIPLYKDALNYYWFGLGSNRTFNRVTNGVNTVLATYGSDTVGVGHGRALEATNRVVTTFTNEGIGFSIAKNGVEKLALVDTDAAARSIFSGSLRCGFGSATNANTGVMVQLISAKLGERREDFSSLENWTVVTGSVSTTGAKGYSGVGLGVGSVMTESDPVPAVEELTDEDLALVVTPDGLPVGPLAALTQDDSSADPEPPAPIILGTPIATASDFVTKVCVDPTGEYTLTADIDLTDSGFSTITTFSGKLHGAGHVLTGLGNKTLATNLSGLIEGLILDGTVDDAPTAVSGGSAGFAPLASVSTDCIISNCTVRGYRISGTSKGGVIAGMVRSAKDGSVFVGCTVEESVSLNGHNNVHVGGLVATVSSSSYNGEFVARFIACTNRASVGNSNGNYNSFGVGGIVASISHNASTYPFSEFLSCVNEGAVSGAALCNVGGIVGVVGGSGTTAGKSTQRIVFDGCLNAGPMTITADSSNVGGMIGACTTGTGIFSLTGCVNRADISTATKGPVGGMIGLHEAPNKLDVIRTDLVNCVNEGTLSGTNVGGFIGKMYASDGWACGKWYFTDCDNYGNICAPMPGYAGLMSETSGQIYGQFTGTSKSSIQIVISGCRGLNAVAAGPASKRAPTSVDLQVFAPFTETPPAGKVGVLFQDWNGNVIVETNVTIGASAIAPDDPVREGHTFVGWDHEFGPISESTAYQALYTTNRYEAAFDVRGGAAVASLKVNYGTTIDWPISARAGYVFSGWSSDGATKVSSGLLMPPSDMTFRALWRPIEDSYQARAKLRLLQWRVNCPSSKPSASSSYATGFRSILTTNDVSLAVLDNYKSVSYLDTLTPGGYTLVGRVYNGTSDGNTRVVGWKTSPFRQLVGGGSLLGEKHVPASNCTTGWTVVEDVRSGHQYLLLSAWWAKGKTIMTYVNSLVKQLNTLRETYPAARLVLCADYSEMLADNDFKTTYGGSSDNLLVAFVSATGLIPVQCGGDLQWTLSDVAPKEVSVRAVNDAAVSDRNGYLSDLRFGGEGPGTVFLIQ